jgi:hypothetical protein
LHGILYGIKIDCNQFLIDLDFPVLSGGKGTLCTGVAVRISAFEIESNLLSTV